MGVADADLEDIAAGRPLVVHPSDPMLFSPIHERDIVAQLAALVDVRRSRPRW